MSTRLLKRFGGIAIPTLLLCAMLPASTEGFTFGKKEKEELERVKAELTACKAELENLQKAKAELEKQLSTERAQFEKKEAEYKEQISKLERGRGICVFFFGGDIIYEVAASAFRDYKAGLRFRTLIDSNFATAFKLFEEGKAGDAEVLAVIKEIDTSGDKYVDTTEASRFRKAEEDKYGKIEIMPPAK